jgi:glycosyltransferase involved in cell wall biosynthesis
MNGTYQDFEVLLVDDGSTDGTGLLCDQLAEQHKKIKVFHTENRGLSMARNLGMDHAVGKYVGFVDSDDLIAPEMYASLVGQMKDEVQMVCCRYQRCKWEAVAPINLSGTYRVYTDEGLVEQIFCNHYNANVCMKLFRRDILESNQIRFKQGCLMEDQYFIADYLRVCHAAAFTNDRMYYYIDTPGSIMNSFRDRPSVGYRYVDLPRSWVYSAEATTPYKKICRTVKARAAVHYQSVLRKIVPENKAFIAEARAYVKKHLHLLLLQKWMMPYFVSGLILSVNYTVWSKIFRRGL